MNKNRNSTCVVDASYVLSLLLPDEKSRHQDVPQKMIAPSILDYEIVNGLRSSVIRNRVTSKLAVALHTEYQKLPIILKKNSFTQVLSLSIEYELSAYDTSYLALSKNLGLNLYTLDKRLLKIAQSFLKK